jgi:hypothetical protein
VSHCLGKSMSWREQLRDCSPGRVFAPLLALAHQTPACSEQQLQSAVCFFFERLASSLRSEKVLIPSLFHHRYADTVQELGIGENAFLLHAFQSYVDQTFPAEEDTHTSSPEYVTTTRVLRYIRSHDGHLDNSLVGLQPSDYTLVRVVPFSSTKKLTQETTGEGGEKSGRPSSPPVGVPTDSELAPSSVRPRLSTAGRGRSKLGAHRTPASSSTASGREAATAKQDNSSLERWLLSGENDEEALSLERLATAVYELGLLGREDGEAALEHLGLLARALNAAAVHGRHATLKAGQLVLVRLTCTQAERKRTTRARSHSDSQPATTADSTHSSTTVQDTESRLYFARVVTTRTDQLLRFAVEPPDPIGVTSGRISVHANGGGVGANGGLPSRSVAAVLDKSKLLMRSMSLSSQSRAKRSSNRQSLTNRSSPLSMRSTARRSTRTPSFSPNSDTSRGDDVDATVEMLMRRTLKEPSEVVGKRMQLLFFIYVYVEI